MKFSVCRLKPPSCIRSSPCSWPTDGRVRPLSSIAAMSRAAEESFTARREPAAHAGETSSPLCCAAAVSYSALMDRNYTQKVPKKVRRLALKMALSSKLNENELMVLDQFELEKIKTGAFVDVLKTLKLENALFVTEKKNENLELSSRNVPDVKVLRSEGLNVYDILKYRTLVLLEPAVKNIEGRLRA